MFSFLGGALGAMGTQQQAESQAKAARYNAEQADQDASIADANASMILQQANSDERKMRIMGRKVMGNMRASFGSSGFQADGNAEDLIHESAANLEEDVGNMRRSALNQSSTFTLDARRKRSYADMLRSGADATIAAGYLSGAGQMLGATASTLSQYK